MRAVSKVLAEHIPHCAIPFLDDIGVKGSRDNYDNEEVLGLPGVRRFMLEHLQNLDKVLADIERAGATISGEKSKFCVKGMKVIGYVCDTDGRHPEVAKIATIVEWEGCDNMSDARAFIGVCVYYRIWIQDFAVIAAPIYYLFQKDVIFHWEQPQKDAMWTL